MQQTNRKKQFLLGATFVSIILLAILLSNFLSNSNTAVELVASTGYIGVFVLGIIGGLNLFVPIPPAVFTELYTAAGLQTIGIIGALAIGTLLADMLGYFFGHISKTVVTEKYPKILAYTEKVTTLSPAYIIGFVIFYAAVVPFPNEAILIPLAISGISWRLLLIPLLIGNIIHQTILVVGLQELLQLL